jgi:hypothetical protein
MEVLTLTPEDPSGKETRDGLYTHATLTPVRSPLLPAFASLSLLACAAPPRQGATLVEKGAYQAVYGPGGHLERVAYDGDGDRRAEVVTFFGTNGRPLRAEVDSDRDGVVDRWEVYGPDGKLLKVGTASRAGGLPDTWSYAGPSGQISRREYDADGDGRPERIEHLVDGRVVALDLDLDGDGRCERRLVKNAAGETLRIEIDQDGDGVFERQIPVARSSAR